MPRVTCDLPSPTAFSWWSHQPYTVNTSYWCWWHQIYLFQMPDSSYSQLPRKQDAAFSALGFFQSICHRNPFQGCILASNSLFLLLFFSPPRLGDLHLTKEVVVGMSGRRRAAWDLASSWILPNLLVMAYPSSSVLQTLEFALQKLLFCFCFNNPNIYLDERRAIE